MRGETTFQSIPVLTVHDPDRSAPDGWPVVRGIIRADRSVAYGAEFSRSSGYDLAAEVNPKQLYIARLDVAETLLGAVLKQEVSDGSFT